MDDDLGLTLQHLQALNVARASRWHVHGGLSEWTPLEWAGAMAGEAGEACNAAKKLKRLDTAIANHDLRDADPSTAGYRQKVADEVADTVIYGALLCAAVGESLEEAVRRVFNRKSEEYGFPERL